MVHRREIGGSEVVFGNQGALWNNAMTWWDHDTGSIWSQPRGEAIAGPHRGGRLELLPSTFTSWGSWRAAHPETLALDAPGGPTGFDLDDLFIVVDFGAETTAYPITDVRRVGVVNDTVAGVAIAVVSDPVDPDRWAVFGRAVRSQSDAPVVVELELDGGRLRDRITGSTFDGSIGVGLDGPLAGAQLARLPALTSLPGGGPTRVPIFEAFWPGGTVWRP